MYNEYTRYILSQHKNVVQVYGRARTDKNAQVLLIARAALGDLKSYYAMLIEKHKHDEEDDFVYLN